MYGYQVVAFGDVPAALALELAKELVAESAKAVDPQAAAQLTRNSLVDDIGGGGTRQEVDRMLGEKEESGYTGTVPEVLESCGFRAKALVASGSRDEEELDAVGGKFLGMPYDATSDELLLQASLVIRMKVKRSRQRRADNVPIDEEWLEDLRAGRHQLMKRRVLAYVMSQYDPHGLREPVRIGAKILLRNLYGTSYKGGWDDPLPERMAVQWHGIISEAIQMEGHRIPRALVSEATREFWLVAFWDGSLDAHATCVYARTSSLGPWGEERLESRLILGKSRWRL